MNDYNAEALVEVFFDRDAMMQHLMKLIFDNAGFFKCLSSHDVPGAFVGHPQNHFSAPFICQGDAITCEILQGISSLRFLELKASSFRSAEHRLKLFGSGNRHGYLEFAARAMSATMMITSKVTNATFHALSGKRAWAVPVTALTAPCQVLPRYW